VAPEIEARRRAVVDAPWTWLRQVHGDTVVTVSGPGAGVADVDDVDVCTACSDDYFSWRARGELARQALVVWRD
jgi:copper oxidase (laccase) domain-containing protein